MHSKIKVGFVLLSIFWSLFLVIGSSSSETILNSSQPLPVVANVTGDFPAPPSTPTIYDPGTTIVDGDFTVDWSDSTSEAGMVLYEFEEATSPQINDRGYFVNRVGDIQYIWGTSQYSFTNHAEGTYYFHVRAEDVNNFKSSWSNVVDLTIDFPVISNIQVSNVTQTSATVTWQTDIASNSRVRPHGFYKIYDTAVSPDTRIQGVNYAPVEAHGSDITAAEIDKDLQDFVANNVNAINIFNLGASELDQTDPTYNTLEQRIFAKCAALGIKFVVRLEAYDKPNFNYGTEDADWIIDVYYAETISRAQNYSTSILYYMINMPLDDVDLIKPTETQQRDYVTYFYNRLKTIAPTVPVFVNFHYGTMDELDQASVADIVDGVSIAQYAVRFDAAPYGVDYDVNNNNQPDPGEGPISTDPDYKIIDKDQFDYFIDKLYTRNDIGSYGGTKKVYIDQSGFAELINHWSGTCADRTTKLKAMKLLKEYVENNPQLNGWFYFKDYDKEEATEQATFGIFDTKIQGNESESVINHTVVMTDLFPGTNYEIWAKSGGAESTGPSFTTLTAAPPANDTPTITITSPAYGGVGVYPGEDVVITWRDEDVDNNATISFYYDTNDRGRDGVLIVSGITEDDETDSYTWNTSGLTQGNTYYVYAKIDDGVNQPEYDYSNGKISVYPISSASSIQGVGFEASKAFDDDLNTRWASAHGIDPQWIQMDFGSQREIYRVVLNWENAYATAYQIQVSNDGINWTTVYITTTGDGGIDDISFAPVIARYIRMYGTQRATSYGYSLWEFQIYYNLTGPSRATINLNGTWQLEPGNTTPPTTFNYNVSVPGVVDLATPTINWQNYSYFWYKKTFTLSPTDQHDKAFIKVNKAQYGSEVYLNGVLLGNYIGCFTSHEYDASSAINYNGENILLVRVGTRDTLSVDSAFGNDAEKEFYIPGIIDDVNLILTGKTRITNNVIVPNISTNTAEAKIILKNFDTATANISLVTQVFEKTSGNEASSKIENIYSLAAGEEKQVTVNLSVSNIQLWSPENPFLYKLKMQILKSGQIIDAQETNFGMREFKVVGTDFYLNGNKVFLKGSNISFYRLLDDPARLNLPWDATWIKNCLVDTPKAYNMNYFRIHLGPIYSKWYDLADEYGVLLEDEWCFWGRPAGSESEITAEFTQWMYDNANHPSIVWYNAINEPNNDQPDAQPMINFVQQTVVPQMKAIDPSRPWGWVDYVERHPYIYSYLGVLGYAGLLDEISAMTTPTVINEYNWFWLDRNGNPTLLTDWVMERWVGQNPTNQELLDFQALTVSEITELWRRMGIDCVAPFVYMSSSNGKTSNWFTDLATLTPQQPIMNSLKNVFSPFGVSIELWDKHFLASQTRNFDIYVFNDYTVSKSGTLNCKIVDQNDVTVVNIGSFTVNVPASSNIIQSVMATMPSTVGNYYLKAELIPQGETVPVATSKKVVYVLNAPTVPANISTANIMVYDPDSEIYNYLSSLGLNVSTYNSATLSTQDILILGEGALLDTNYATRRPEITQFIKGGKSLLIIEPSSGVPEGGNNTLNVLDDASVYVIGTPYRGNEAYIFKTDESFSLWNNIGNEHLKFFNGGYGGEIVSAYDVIPQQQIIKQASCGTDLKIPAVMEGIAGQGVLVYSGIQVRGRLTEESDPGTGLYSRRVDSAAQQYILNLISTYFDTSTNWQRINQTLKTMPLFVKRATTSSVQGDDLGLGPEKAVDGYMDSRWSSRWFEPQWIKLDFGSPQKINQIKLFWEAAYGKSYSIQVSNDENNWTTVYSTTTGDGGTDDITFPTVIARYIRMYGTERGIGAGYSLYEVESYYNRNEDLGSIDFDKSYYSGTSQQAVVSVVDLGLNTDPNTIQTVNVNVKSDSDPTGISLTLTETSVNSDTFTSQATGTNLSFSEIASSDVTKTIKVSEADRVTVTYQDASPVGTQTIAVIWYTGSNSANIALNRDTAASTSQSADVNSNYAVDDNNYTRWSSEFSDPQWIYVDLGVPKQIKKVILDWERAYGKSYEIQTSNDKTYWTTIYSTTTGDGYVDEIEISPTASARFVRMYGTERGTIFGYSLWEFKIFGDVASTVHIDNYPTSVEQGGTANVDVSWQNIPSDGSFKLVVQLENWNVSPPVYIVKEITSFASTGNQTVNLSIPTDTTLASNCRFVAAFISTTEGWNQRFMDATAYDVTITAGTFPVVSITNYPKLVQQLGTANVDITWANIPTDGTYKLVVQLENWDVTPAVYVSKDITSFSSAGSQTVTLDIPGDATLSTGGRFVAAFISTTVGWDDVLCASYGPKDVEIAQAIVANVNVTQYPNTVYRNRQANVDVSWTNIPTDGTYKLVVQLENWNVTPAVYIATEITTFIANDNQTITLDIPGDTTLTTGCRFVAAFISTTQGWSDTLAAHYAPTDVEVAEWDQADLVAKHTTGTIAIDGQLNESDWNMATPVTFMNSINPDAGVYKGYALWDENYLYFAGTAIDQKLETSQYDWNDDSFTASIKVSGGILSKNRQDIGGTSEGSVQGNLSIVNAVASSIEDATFTPNKAIDNNMGTRWASQHGNDNEWIYVDLGSSKKFNKVVLYWEAAYGAQYQIQISNDASNWTTIYTENNGNGGTDIINVGEQKAQFIKMQGIQRATSYGYSLWEIKVQAINAAFTVNGTVDNNTDTDTSWTVEMRIPWSSSGQAPRLDEMINADFLAVDHDDNPGGAWDAPQTNFYKNSWDLDGNPDTTGKKILLTKYSIMIDDFSDANSTTNVLGLATSDDGTCALNQDINEEHKVNWDNVGDYWYSTLYDGSKYLNSTGTDCLSFKIKGNSGQEQFSVKLEDNVGPQSLNISDYAKIYTIPQRVDIPLRDFTSLDKTKLKKLIFDFNNTPSGTIIFDDVQLASFGPLICTVEYTNAPVIRNDGLPVYFLGSTVDYTLHIRNISDSAVDNLSITAIQEYYETAEGHKKGDALPGTSTENWSNISVAAGATLDLTDTYYIPYETDTGEDQTHVTIKDSQGNVIYDKAEAGLWCPPPFAKASSFEAAGREPDKAIDNDYSTRWSSAWTDNEWIYIDYGEPITFNTVILYWETAYGRQYEIQTSNDGVTWTTIYTENNGDGGTDIINVDNQSARLIKMKGVQRGTAYGYSLWEFKVAMRTVATASSSENSNLAADKVVDNNFTTRWSSAFTDNEWIYLDFGSTRTFDTVKLFWETAYGSAYQIQVSNDATNWTTVYSTSTGDGGEDSIYVGDQTARYVKMQGIQRATPYGYSLWEFEILKATASSVEYAGMEAYRATDSNFASRWSSNLADNEWIYIDYMNPRLFDTVKLNWEAAYATSYEIQISDNGIDWFALHTETNSDGGEDLIYVGDRTARYVKMRGIQRATEWGYSLWEFSILNNTPPTQGEIIGTVNLQSRDYQAELVTFEVRNPGETIPVKTFQMFTGSDGKFVFPHIEPGTYDLTAKASNSLREKQTNVVVNAGAETSGVSLNLSFGDADDDNYIDYKDRNILKKAYGAAPGSSEWDGRADFDRDNIIDYKDRNILKKNYGLSGQP